MGKKIAVLGGGSWGTALAIVLANNGHDTTVWLRDEKQYEDILKIGVNNKYLPDVKLPEALKFTIEKEKICREADLILLSTPTHGVRNILKEIKEYLNEDQIILNVAKGIENESLLRVSEIAEEILGDVKFAVLSGPSHAEEVGRNMPTTVIAASKTREVAEYVQDLFMSSEFRVYTNPDIIGVELGGSLKNVIALGAGISDGLGYGDNTKAALMTRGIFEMARLGEKMGADINTFSGLSGIGDLIVTCTSMHSRNRRAGILIGEGMSTEEAIDQIGMVVEGIKTTKSVYLLSKKYGVSMPITEEIYNVIYNGTDVKLAVTNLMGREKKHEMESMLIENDIDW